MVFRFTVKFLAPCDLVGETLLREQAGSHPASKGGPWILADKGALCHQDLQTRMGYIKPRLWAQGQVP